MMLKMFVLAETKVPAEITTSVLALAAAKSDVAQGKSPDAPAVVGESRDDRLRREATSTLHLMTHIPKNPFCDACCRAKMVQRHGRRRHVPDKPENPVHFGELSTADHFMLHKDDDEGIDGEKGGVSC